MRARMMRQVRRGSDSWLRIGGRPLLGSGLACRIIIILTHRFWLRVEVGPWLKCEVVFRYCTHPNVLKATPFAMSHPLLPPNKREIW